MNLHDLNERERRDPLSFAELFGDVKPVFPDYFRDYQQRFLRNALDRPAMVVHPNRYDELYGELLRYYRQTPMPATVRTLENGPVFDTVEVQTRGTREQNRDALAILRELDWQYMRVREWRARPTDMQRVAFTLTRWEWDTLRQSLDFYELQRHMGEWVEGAAPTYRGYPLVIR